MGKLGLQKIDNAAIAKKTDTKTSTTKKSQKTSDKPGTLEKIALKHSSELVSLVSDIIHGKLEIDRIEAQTDAQVKLIAAEVDKMWKQTNARINEMEADGRVWAEKFDKKHRALLDVIQRIEMHSEWSDDTRSCLIETVRELIKEG